MKKILLTGAFLALATATYAVEFKSGLFTFNTISDNTVELVKVDKADSYVIPSTVTNEGVDYTVTSLGDEVFKWNNATSITLPSTLENIGYGAMNSVKVTSLELPEGLKTIGDYAFSSAAITSLTCPSTLESIGYSAFFTCKSLTSIKLNEGLKKIGGSAFYKVPIAEIEIPSTVTEIEKATFLNCPDLTTVKMHDGIVSIGDNAFHNCAKLTSITLPANVKSIGSECFLKTPIAGIELPASLETLGTSAFAVTKISEIKLAEGNENFVLVDGVLYDAEKRLLYQVPMVGRESVTVDAKCIGINGGAFWGSQVKNVKLPENMLAIDDYAFCQSELADINLPAGITFIGEQAFAATKLASVVLPASMTLVQDGVLAGCENLTSVVIPSAAKLIYNHAFHNDKKLTSVTCLGSVAPEIDDTYEAYDDPFYNVPSTATLYVPKGSTQSYKNAGWNNYFTIVEGETGHIGYASITPADGAVLGKSAAMKVEITFSTDVTIVEKNPEVFLRKGSELSGAVIEPDDAWVVNKGGDNKSIVVWASDYDGYTQTFSPDFEAEYYMIIPGGIVKDSEGNTNDRIVLKWQGPSQPKTLEVVSTIPATGSVIATKYPDMDFYVTFADDVTILDYGPNVKLIEGDIENGKTLTPEDRWKCQKDSENTIQIFGMNYDGYVDYFVCDPNKKYYFIIPAGIVQNAAGDKNGEIIIEMLGQNVAGIGEIAVDGNLFEVGRYDLNGRPVGENAKGICIIKMSDGSVRKAVVR